MHSDYFVYNTVVRYFIDRNLTRRRGISFFFFFISLPSFSVPFLCSRYGIVFIFIHRNISTFFLCFYNVRYSILNFDIEVKLG